MWLSDTNITFTNVLANGPLGSVALVAQKAGTGLLLLSLSEGPCQPLVAYHQAACACTKSGDVTSHCYNHLTVARLWSLDTDRDKPCTCSHREAHLFLFSGWRVSFYLNFFVSTAGNVMYGTCVFMFVTGTDVDSGKCRLFSLEHLNRA